MTSFDQAATDFYDALAPMFDVMTDWNARLDAEGPFLKAMLEEAGAQSVLDAACGSGGHALALAQWGQCLSITGDQRIFNRIEQLAELLPERLQVRLVVVVNQ